jgi:hypothetical protein
MRIREGEARASDREGTMVKDSEISGRLWRRVAGLGAFGAFCCGILLAFGLARLVLLALALVALMGLVAAVVCLLARYRERFLRSAGAAHRAVAPAAVRIWKVSRFLVVRSADRGMKAARGMARQLRPGLRTLQARLRLLATQTSDHTRKLLDRAVPAARRALSAGIVQLQAARVSGARHVSRASAVIAADVADHRARYRAARPGAAERPQRRRPPDLPAPVAPLGWQGKETGEGLDTHDEVEPEREAENPSSSRRGEVSASSPG